MLKNFLIFALCVFAYLPQRTYSESNYFSNPCLYSSEELAQELKEKELNMCWDFGQNSHFYFAIGNDETYFEICLENLPDTYNDFIARIQNKFIQEKESKRLSFSYRIKNEREEINAHKMLKRNVHPNKYSYLVTDRRIMENATPQQISKEKLAEIIAFKKSWFYTGASISALEVPAIDELHQLLGLEINERFFSPLENRLNNPRAFASKIQGFHKACFFDAPAKAHLALKELAVLKNIRINFSYKIKNEREEINAHKILKKNVHPNKDSYLVTDRRIMENAKPQQISREKLAEIIAFKKILFYTGAGISALKIPTMDELHQLLGLEINEKFLFSLENVLNNPRSFVSKIQGFYKVCFFCAPTKAHLALKELAVFKNIRIITENLDRLHEASGISPYRVDAKQLREEIGESLTEFDYVIAIGLKLDDRGFLGWYKKQNPQGKIIAVNLNKPSYLGDEDFLLIGDLQEVIPTINAQIKYKPLDEKGINKMK